MPRLFRILSCLTEPMRVAALRFLWADGRNHCLCEIMGVLSLPQARAARHMVLLREAGLVTSHKVGSWIHYQRNTDLSSRWNALVEKALDTLSDEQPAEAMGSRR